MAAASGPGCGLLGRPGPLGVLRDRQDYPEHRPAVGSITRVHFAVMGLDDRLDDRQAEPSPAAPTTPACVRAPEAIEHPVAGVGRQTGPVVTNLEHSPFAFTAKGDIDHGFRGRVHHRVSGHVGEHLTQLLGIR
jgi:hypothetical protein